MGTELYRGIDRLLRIIFSADFIVSGRELEQTSESDLIIDGQNPCAVSEGPGFIHTIAYKMTINLQSIDGTPQARFSSISHSREMQNALPAFPRETLTSVKERSAGSVLFCRAQLPFYR